MYGVSGNDLVGHSCVWSEWKGSDWTLVCGVSGKDLVGRLCVWGEWKGSGWTLMCVKCVEML